MPIVFASPQPFDAAASYASGQASMGPNFSDVLKAWQTQQSMKMQGAELQAKLAMSDADRRQSGAELAYRMSHQDMSDRNQQQAAITMNDSRLAQADNEAALNANVRLQLQQGEFTQADKLRMDRYNYAKSQVGAMLDSKQITPEEANDYLGQIMAGESVLQSKYKNAQGRAMAEKEQMSLRMAHVNAGLFSADAATRAQAFNSRIVYDPQSGQRLGWIDAKGDLQPLQEKSAKESLPPGTLTEQQFAGIKTKVRQNLERGLQDRYNQLALDPSQGNAAYERDWWNDTRKAQKTDQLMQEMHGLPATYQQYLASRTGQGGNASTPLGQQPTSPQAQPLPVGKPIAKPEDASEPQKLQLSLWDQLGKNADQSAATADQKKGYAESVDWAKKALSTYGDVRAMPPVVAEQYKAILQAMAPLRPAKPKNDVTPTPPGQIPDNYMFGYQM